MALETLKGVTVINGFAAVDVNDVPEHSQGHHEFREYLKSHPIVIDHDWNLIMFKIQDKPIKEVGVNGCQVDTLIEAALIIVAGLNTNFPCEENNEAITYLIKAMQALKRRTINREARGVEGTSQE